MILLLAIFAGLLAGFLRARVKRRKLSLPELRLIWIVPVAFLPQLFAFQIPATRLSFPDRWIPAVLIGSLLLLLVFVLANLHQPGFWLLGAGLLLNLTVIAFNGGWMPISQDTVQQLAPHAPSGSWEIGKRLGSTKDKVLSASEIRLWLLADRFTLPGWIPFHVAFSIGDIVIAMGAFWFLWTLGGPAKVK